MQSNLKEGRNIDPSIGLVQEVSVASYLKTTIKKDQTLILQYGVKKRVKLEVGTKPGSGPVQIVVIFKDLVKHMKEAVGDEPLVVLTATDKLFFENKDMDSEEFQKAFKVDKIKGRVYKVMLGFKLRTTTTLYDIKQRLMKPYLIPNDLFMREHVGGFVHGVNYHSYGFLKGDHPDNLISAV